jgi:hypothetical protein
LKRDGGGQDRAPTGCCAAGIVSAAGAPAGIEPDAGRLDEAPQPPVLAAASSTAFWDDFVVEV